VESQPSELAQLARSLVPWSPHLPHPPQAVFLALGTRILGSPVREALYGGAAGGGKSDALLMAGLQYADTPGYAALLMRRSFAQLAKPDALMDRAHQWLRDTPAHWDGERKRWIFPSQATLSFGYLETEKDKYEYQGAAYQFVGFDELTQFTETQWQYLFSRTRRKVGLDVPIRSWASANPGGEGHDWVKRRFLVEGRAHGRVFVPATLDDNPSLDREDYLLSLMALDPVTRDQLLRGDWDARAPGGMFRREWYRQIVKERPKRLRLVRYWDLAATEPHPGNTDPDWTAGALVGLDPDGMYWICDIRRARLSPGKVEQFVKATAIADGRATQIFVEQEPGSSGKALVHRFIRDVLSGYAAHGNPATGKKLDRARPVSAQVEIGNVGIIDGPWLGDWFDESEAFAGQDGQGHDDQVDAVSGAFERLQRSEITLE
jgi:predicted phage terminase large subunit-like protein